MKKPGDCESIDSIRIEIDRIDRQIIALISERLDYIREITRFKSNSDDVKAQKRYDELFVLRRKWAEENGVSPDAIEQVYKILVHYFIDEQMKLIENRNKQK
jgi:isochorismate pyruvate lyase